MTLLADTCPSCRNVHGQPTDWPVCPEHGHWLYVLRGPLAQPGTGWTYACQAHKCTYTHTQRERATMTATHEQATAALAIRDGQQDWTPQQLAVLRSLGAEEADADTFQMFLHYCQATGLDPFARQIRLRKDRERIPGKDNEYKNRWSIETEIDGLRVIAHRVAKEEGVELSYGPVKWFDAAGGAHDIWTGDEPPFGASLTVYKDRAMFPAVVRFRSFAKYNNKGQLMAQWATMPDHMIAKCAEAQALRKAFPHDLGDIRTSDETAPPPGAADDGSGRAQVTSQAPGRSTASTPRSRPGEEARSNRQALNAAIRKEFDRLGLEDPEERGVYVNKLNNRPGDAPLRELTEKQLEVALEVLKDDKEVPDIAALVELCSPEPVTDES